MRHHFVIYINGQRHEISGADAGLTLSDFLRYRLRLTGIKVVCAEGDCGSCTVSLGRVVGDTIAYTTVCGCIQRLYQLDACHIVTVEGLKYEGKLNPLQEAMVTCHGAQCGFCTPGFVVTMHALLEDKQAKDETTVRRKLTGNLCRCTGYQSLIDSAAQCDVSSMKPIGELYPTESLLKTLAPLASEPAETVSDELRVFKPTTLDEAIAFRAANPGCVIIAGGTDLGVVMNKRKFSAAVLMTTTSIPELGVIESRDNALVVGGNVTHAQVQRAIAQRVPKYDEYLEYFGSPQIRNVGTLAGNLATGSPIGDSLPPLFVLGAEIELAGPKGRRVVNINDFYTGYRTSVMAADELISRITIPLPDGNDTFRLYKLSKRKDLDISTFSAAVLMKMRDGIIDSIHIAMGGVGPMVVRLKKTEAILRGQPFDEATFANVRDSVLSEITPISDVRGSADYRNLLAGNILSRMHAELAAPAANGNGSAS